MPPHVHASKLFPCSGFLVQNCQCRLRWSSMTSTSSMGRPLVSGTHTITKTNATSDIPPKMRKVHDVPIASVRDRKDCATIRLETQFAVAAIPPQTPLYLRGYISEFTIQGTVPIPGEKNMMYRARPINASQPNRLGHPLVYHSLPSPWQTSLTVEFDTQHAPGKSFNTNILVREARFLVWTMLMQYN